MTTQALTDLTLETLDNYRVAATQAVAAYRAGGYRLVEAVNGAVESQIVPRTAKVAPAVAERMDEVRGSVNAIVVKGLDAVVERTEAAIERSSEFAAAQLSKVAGFAAEIDNQMIVGGLDTAARLSMPVARFGLVVSGKVAEGATSLADVAGAHPVKKAVRKAASTARRRATPVARRAKAEVKTAVKRAGRAAGRARKAVAQATA